MKKLIILLITIIFFMSCAGNSIPGGNPSTKNQVVNSQGEVLGTFVKKATDDGGRTYIEILSSKGYYFFITTDGFWYLHFTLAYSAKEDDAYVGKGVPAYLTESDADMGKKYYERYELRSNNNNVYACSSATEGDIHGTDGPRFEPNFDNPDGNTYYYKKRIAAGSHVYALTACSPEEAGAYHNAGLFPPFTVNGKEI